MKTYFFALIAVLLITVSCENSTQKASNNEVEVAVVEEVIPLDLADFSEKAGDLVGKQVELYGMIDHVCKHGGQKMFLVNEDGEVRVKIVTGENMAAFNTELEGESVNVIGIVDELRIDEEYLKEWEEEVLAGLEGDDGEKGEKVHMGEHQGSESGENPELGQINDYRKKIAESGKNYISFFSVICVDYEVDDSETDDEV
jgi:hypothetical protein